MQALADPAKRDRLARVVSDAPCPSWSASAHAHVATITSYLQSKLAKEIPAQAKRPLHHYLSDTAWDLQKQVTWLRRRLAGGKAAIYRQTTAAVFYGWRGDAQGFEEITNPSAWLCDAQTAEALCGFWLGIFAKTLRSRCKSDRVACMASLADNVQANCHDSPVAVNRLLCRRRKKPYAPAVFLAIENANGALCETPAQTTRRWREHFSLEDGVAARRSWLRQLSTEAPANGPSQNLALCCRHCCGPDARRANWACFALRACKSSCFLSF